jgi:DNA-binding NtrC family response regulator
MAASVTILIVDDEEIVHKLVRVALKEVRGHRVPRSERRHGSLEDYREYRGPIHLLLSHVVMPGRMNGTEMAALLSHTRPQIKVVLMSGYAPEALTMEPDWQFIQKPFRVPEI